VLDRAEIVGAGCRGGGKQNQDGEEWHFHLELRRAPGRGGSNFLERSRS
jgi:hypothetical protein